MPHITLAYALFLFSATIYAWLWIWAMVHAAQTPKTEQWQRALWVGGLLVNPFAAIWYWYIWKRWAFWTLFTPLLGFFISFPVIVRSFLMQTGSASSVSNFLHALGASQVLTIVACLMIFPFVLRVVALFHLGKNSELNAMDRNDWVIALALPIFGFGAGFAYCAKYKRGWALVSLVWWVAFALSSRYIWINVSQDLIDAGMEQRAATSTLR